MIFNVHGSLLFNLVSHVLNIDLMMKDGVSVRYFPSIKELIDLD